MTIWDAVFWGAFSSAALFIGQWLSGPMTGRERMTGQLMGFGAGAMLSAVAYELVPLSVVDNGWDVGAMFLLGSLVYYVADRIIDSRGGADRVDIDGGEAGGSGMAMFLGALLDGIPEAFVLGISLFVGGEISVAFVAAVFISNIPQGVAGTMSLLTAGANSKRVATLWGSLTLACGVAAAIGFAVADRVPDEGFLAQAFAAGAVLTMLADSMMPEAFEHGGKTVGLLTVVGFLVAATLSVMQ